MTDEYKKELLKYITGNLTLNNSTNDEIFKELNNQNINKWNNFVPDSWFKFRFEGLISPSESTSNYYILYGGYIESSETSITKTNAKGIIILLDNNFNPIKTFYQYDNGTTLRYIQCMKQAEDNTFYFIDDTHFSYTNDEYSSTSEKRFVMINNITALNTTTKDYNLIMRKDYLLNDYNFYCKDMFKNSISSHYTFSGSLASYTGNSWDYDGTKIIDFKINVGSNNTWNIYYLNGYLYSKSIINYDSNDNFNYKSLSSTILSGDLNIYKLYMNYGDSSISSSELINLNYRPIIDEFYYTSQCIWVDENIVYFVTNNQSWGIIGTPNDKYIGLYKYNFSNSTLTTIYKKSLGSYVFSNLEAIYLSINNDEIYIQYNNNISNNKADYYFQRLINDKWNPILISSQTPFYYYIRNIYVQNNFNLLNIYLYSLVPSTPYFNNINIKEDYNNGNYNGNEYIDYDLFIPKKVELFDNNNSMVFARNLSNITINNNTTESTAIIPNTYLNDLIINMSNLLSNTNFKLIEGSNGFSKNIYETVYLNFISSINVLDSNNSNNELLNEVANKINNNINVGTLANYSNYKISKAIINYIDDTNISANLKWNDINEYNSIATFTFTPTKLINNIQIVSNDSSFSYLTLDDDSIKNLLINNSYTIHQKIRTGNIAIYELLQYNSENVYYNNEQVYAYSN